MSGPGSRLRGLQRENGRLHEQLRSSEELNSSLRSELDLHRSIMAQTSSRPQDRDDGKQGPASRAEREGDAGAQETRLSSGNFQGVSCSGGGWERNANVCVPVRLAGGAPAGDPSAAAAFGGEHPHQRPSEGAAGEEAG